jgi:MSHA biogenesis protein MshJ
MTNTFQFKPWWDKQAARIDALSVRERVFMFMVAIVCTLALADIFWLSPAQAAHKLVLQRFAAQGTELGRLRDDLRTSAKAVDPSKQVRDDLAQETAQLDTINQQIKAVAPMADGGPALEQVLVQFLQPYDKLTLLGVNTMKSDATSAPAAASATTDTATVTKRGLELKVSGPYAELTRYVKTLENALPTLRWGAIQLKSERQQMPELSLQVYVVGVPQ